MKSPVLRIVSGLFLSMFCLSSVSAATGDTGSLSTPLLVESIQVIDDSHVAVEFNQDVIRESVRVRITKQSDESNVRIETFTGGDNARTTSVVLVDTLAPSTAYKVVIVSAISEGGILIRDGADGIKEFTTPIDLKSSSLTLNAPTNPSAIKVTASGTTVSPATSTGIVKPAETPKKEASPADTAKELPLSGMNSTLFLILAGALALILLMRRRRA